MSDRLEMRQKRSPGRNKEPNLGGKETRSSKGTGFRVTSCIAILWLGYVVSGSETAVAADAAESKAAVERFVLKEQQLWEQRRKGQLSTEEWNEQYNHLIVSEAEQFQSLMPGIVRTLGERPRYRSEKDRRLEELVQLSHPTSDDLAEMQVLLHDDSLRNRFPTCGMALLTGYLGRTAPKEAVEEILTAAPSAEQSEDLCLVRALMSIGPEGYEPILERLARESNSMRTYVGVMALVAQAADTEFPEIAGLGKKEQWDRSFPKSTRALRRVTKEWERWWATHRNEYDWNPATSLLEPKKDVLRPLP